jgi:RHS repeat-associated protein
LNTILTFDSWGNLIRKDQVFDTTTLTTLIDYDSLNRPVRITSPGGNVSQAAYDDRNNLVQYTDPAGQAYHYTYDNRNQLTRLTNPNGVVEAEMSYDGRGNLTRLQQPGGHAYTYSYDERGNLLTATDPSGNLEEFTYDANGYLLTYTNAADELTAYNHDASGKLLSLTDAAGRTTQFGYDDQGNALTITDERGNVQRFAYNYWGSVTSYRDALGRQVTYQYDAERRLTGATDRNGQSISYAYDEASRLIRRTLQSGEITDIAYDPLGRVLSLVDSDARIEFSYDSDSNLISQRTLGVGASSQPDVTLNYTHNARGERLSMSGPGGMTSYAYDLAGQLTGLTAPGGRAYSFGYDPLGRLTALARPNGVNDTLQYSPAGDLLLRRSSLGAVTLAESAYSVYPTGQRASLANLDGSLSFANNQVGWLVNVTSSTSGLLEAFTYDQVGNRTSWNGSPSALVSYNGANHLLSDGRYLYTYDSEGNLIQRQERSSGAITTFSWNEAGELLSIQHPDGSATRFRYDPLGRRIETDSAGVITRYVYDGPNAHLEYNAGNELSAIYTSGIAYDAMLSMTRDGNHYDYLHDGLGSVVALVDEAGNVVQSYSYNSSGAPTASGSLANPFTFTGREYEPRSGMYYFRGRYMDPWSGRFLSEDIYPTVNSYPYVHNAPLDYVDPSGWAATAEYAILSSDDEAQAAAEARLGASLADRAANLAKLLDRIAQNHRVVGVGRFFNPQTGETFTRVAVSSNRWSTALRGALNPGEAIRAFAGEHAEQALVRYAVQNGYQLRAVGASRHICDAICRPLLKGLGMIFGP